MSDRAGLHVERVEGSWGMTWRLMDGDLILDAYSPWNGDDRPDWMPDEP